MIKQILLKSLLGSLLLIASSFTKLLACTGPDIIFTNITITGINFSTSLLISYDYEIKNIGTDTIFIKKLIIQNYVSPDNVYGGNDVAAGGSYIDQSSLTYLLSGQTYSGSFTAYSPNSIATDPYLIPLLEYNDGTRPDCDLNNNTIVACLYPDATINSVTITSISPGNVQYDYIIKNAGADTLFLNQLTIQNYVSTDNVYDGADPSAGSGLVSSGTDYVTANQIYSGSFTATPGVSTTTYPYLITHLSYSNTECNITNNDNVTYIQVLSATLNSANSSDNILVNWNSDTKSFSVNNWKNNSTGNLQYKVFAPTGLLLISSNTNVNELTTLPTLANGMYILIISDDQKMYSKRIIY